MTNKGVEADSATIALVIPNGVKVVTATGTGYKGVRMDKQAKANVAEWTVAKLIPNDKQAFSITLAKALPESDHLKGSIHWMTRGFGLGHALWIPMCSWGKLDTAFDAPGTSDLKLVLTQADAGATVRVSAMELAAA